MRLLNLPSPHLDEDNQRSTGGGTGFILVLHRNFELLIYLEFKNSHDEQHSIFYRFSGSMMANLTEGLPITSCQLISLRFA